MGDPPVATSGDLCRTMGDVRPLLFPWPARPLLLHLVHWQNVLATLPARHAKLSMPAGFRYYLIDAKPGLG